MQNTNKGHITIGIDGNEANVEKRVGVNEYAFEIVWNLWKLLKAETRPIAIVVYLKRGPNSHMPPATDNFKYKILSGGPLWVVTRLMPYLFYSMSKPDVMFTPSHYVAPFAPMPRACAIMDLGYLEFSGQFKRKDYWQLKLWSAWSITVSKCIMTISNSSANDIVRHYSASKDKVMVTYPGYSGEVGKSSVSKGSIDGVKKQYSIVGDYILFLSTLKPSKNVEGLLHAWGKIVHNYPNITLVVAGKKGWLYDSIFRLVQSLALTEKVIFTDYVEEGEKAPLIAGAKVFVIPSYWEGFGIDVLTSFALETVVIASNRGSLPEVVGNAGLLINPNNSDEIASAISKVLEMNKKEYNSLATKGLTQLKKFSWEETAKRTLDALVSIVK